MLHLKQDASEPGTDAAFLSWNLPACASTLMCKVGHLFGAGTAIVCFSEGMSVCRNFTSRHTAAFGDLHADILLVCQAQT